MFLINLIFQSIIVTSGLGLLLIKLYKKDFIFLSSYLIVSFLMIINIIIYQSFSWDYIYINLIIDSNVYYWIMNVLPVLYNVLYWGLLGFLLIILIRGVKNRVKLSILNKVLLFILIIFILIENLNKYLILGFISPTVLIYFRLLLFFSFTVVKTHKELRALNKIQNKDEKLEEYIKQLSPREQEVFHLLIQFKTYKNIQDELCISMDTVKSHIKKIYKKLGVNSKNELLQKIV